MVDQKAVTSVHSTVYLMAVSSDWREEHHAAALMAEKMDLLMDVSMVAKKVDMSVESME